MNSITSQNIPNSSTGVQQTQNPKQIQGQVQIEGRAWSIKQMDDSFSQKNTTEKKADFLHDAKHLHQRREVHEKGIFHANYEGKGFFGSIGQFFKNIKLSFEKNDMNALQKTLEQGYEKYSDAYASAKISISGDKKERLEQLQKDISGIENFLRSMIIKGSGSLPENHPLWSAANKFAVLGNRVNQTNNESRSKNT